MNIVVHFSCKRGAGGLKGGQSSPSWPSTRSPVSNLKPCKVLRISLTTWVVLIEPWNWNWPQSCGHAMSPLRSSKLMWPHPLEASSMSRTQACCPIKSCTSQLLRYMVSEQLPTSVLTTCKHKDWMVISHFLLFLSYLFVYTSVFRLLVCLFVCLTTGLRKGPKLSFESKGSNGFKSVKICTLLGSEPGS